MTSKTKQQTETHLAEKLAFAKSYKIQNPPLKKFYTMRCGRKSDFISFKRMGKILWLELQVTDLTQEFNGPVLIKFCNYYDIHQLRRLMADYVTASCVGMLKSLEYSFLYNDEEEEEENNISVEY